MNMNLRPQKRPFSLISDDETDSEKEMDLDLDDGASPTSPDTQAEMIAASSPSSQIEVTNPGEIWYLENVIDALKDSSRSVVSMLVSELKSARQPDVTICRDMVNLLTSAAETLSSRALELEHTLSLQLEMLNQIASIAPKRVCTERSVRFRRARELAQTSSPSE